ncbi:MAG: hypothetical protein HYX68_25815 [Planctomycetes bacterium]|nr:hypothetical protein [Planctomycetota bacterium]
MFWTSKNDLDLEVVEPGDEKIFWGHRQSRTGGRLDLDMNVFYDKAAKNAVENIFWPKGKAPIGRYKVYVHHFNNHGKADCEDPARFTVRVLIRGTPRWFHGEVPFKDAQRRRVLVHEFDVR